MLYSLNETQIRKALVTLSDIKTKQKDFSKYLELFNTELCLKRQLRLLHKQTKTADNLLPFTAKKESK